MFSLRSLVAGAILMAAPVLAAVTPQQIADSLKSITKQARELQAPAQSITNVNAPLIIIRQGPLPPLIKGFEEIVSTANALIDQLPNTEPIQKRNVPSRITRRGPDAELVFETFRALVRAHQDLLNILIGKAGLLTRTPFVGRPIASVLRKVEGSPDLDQTISFTLINLTEARARDIESEAKSLGNTLDLCIKQWEGLQP
ncbi:UVI-1 [Corynascus similis CBS 632.67]